METSGTPRPAGGRGASEPSESPQFPRALDFLTLEQAAVELGTGRQGVVALLAELGIAIRRIAHGGRTLSGISRGELALLRRALDAAGESASATDLAARCLAAERALEEARLDQEVAREACEQLARVRAEAEALERRGAELRERLARQESELTRSAQRRATAEARALELERELAAERRAKEQAFERRDALGRELALAQELERAHSRRLDRLERELAAAKAASKGHGRRPA
jgi:hypothetical protein